MSAIQGKLYASQLSGGKPINGTRNLETSTEKKDSFRKAQNKTIQFGTSKPPNQKNADFIDAGRLGDLNKMKQLLASGAEINGAESGFTALHSSLRHPEIIQFLLENGADTHQAAWDGKMPIEWAARSHATLLGNPAAYLKQQLNHQNRVKLFLDHGATQDQMNKALYQAADQNQGIVKMLLEKGANPNMTYGDKQKTPLHRAASAIERTFWPENDYLYSPPTEDKIAQSVEASSKVMNVLFEHGVNVNAQDKAGLTPLHLAAQEGHSELVQKLLERSEIKVDLKNAEGKTAIMLAAYHGRNSIVQDLKNKNAQFSTMNLAANSIKGVFHRIFSVIKRQFAFLRHVLC